HAARICNLAGSVWPLLQALGQSEVIYVAASETAFAPATPSKDHRSGRARQRKACKPSTVSNAGLRDPEHEIDRLATARVRRFCAQRSRRASQADTHLLLNVRDQAA